MKSLKRTQYAFLSVLLLALAGCSYFGLPKPENLTERLAYAHSAVNSVIVSTTNALNVDAISVADAQYVRKSASDTRQFLEAAEVALTAGDLETAEARLILAQNILSQLQRYLAAKGVR